MSEWARQFIIDCAYISLCEKMCLEVCLCWCVWVYVGMVRYLDGDGASVSRELDRIRHQIPHHRGHLTIRTGTVEEMLTSAIESDGREMTEKNGRWEDDERGEWKGWMKRRWKEMMGRCSPNSPLTYNSAYTPRNNTRKHGRNSFANSFFGIPK